MVVNEKAYKLQDGTVLYTTTNVIQTISIRAGRRLEGDTVDYRIAWVETDVSSATWLEQYGENQGQPCSTATGRINGGSQQLQVNSTL